MFTVLICGNIQTEKLAAFSQEVAVLSRGANYYPIEISPPFGDEPLDSEVSGGASQFYSAMNCNYMAYINCLPESNKKIKYSCSEISEDLTDYFVKVKDRSEFLQFVKNLAKALIVDVTEELYIVFADEWDEGQDIRLIESDFDGVISYFTENNSWDLWLYNVDNRSYVTKHPYIPLVFKVS
ncbi:hypothetical protein ACFOEK_00200 [Litoribrevibacter euphylliae]|uniref:DUF695 domain-containing protein n=1 Tax=Litoribrevibacter euphylliae TaxID=1834034 RepID=A0ABV7HDK0_9GAMM